MKMKKLSMKLLLLLVLCVIGVMYQPKQEAFAAGTPVQVCAVSYSDESLLVFINGNSKIFFATEMDASKGNWDQVEVKPTDKVAVIDLSWLSANTENIIKIKGDTNETESRIIIKDKPAKLQVSINYSVLDSLAATDTIGELLNIMATEGTGENPITFSDLQWKKGDSGDWMSSVYLTKERMENYLIKGTNLYFRIAPVDDIAKATDAGGLVDISDRIREFPYLYPKDNFSGITFGPYFPDGTKGRRASDEVKVKIAKKATLPVTGIDGEEFTAEIRYGQEYRVSVTNGGTTTTSGWTKVTDRLVKRLPLKTMIGGTYDGLTDLTAFPELLLEIRNYSTTRASSSRIIQTSLSPQRILTGSIILGNAPTGVTAADKNIYITYNGTKNMNVQIPSASDSNPYEYCVVKQGASFDLTKATWTSITKNTIVKILSTKALDYSTLYIRMKEVKYKAATDSSSAIAYKLASTLKTFAVNYPSIPTAPKATYVFTKGYPSTITIDVTLNVTNKMPFETKLKYVKLGTKDVPVVSSDVTPTGTIDSTKVYTMKIILDSNALKDMTNCTARALSIYYDNGTVDKTSSKLTIKNPSAALPLGTSVSIGEKTVGTTIVTIVGGVGTDNSLVYQLGDQVKSMNMEDKFTTGIPFTPGMEIAIPTPGQYLTIYEINKDGYVMKFKSIQINSDKIKQP